MTIMIEPSDREPVKVTPRTKYYYIPVYFACPTYGEVAWRYIKAFKELDTTFRESHAKKHLFAVNIPILNTRRLAGADELTKDDIRYYGNDFYIFPDGWFLNKRHTFLGVPFLLRKEDCRIVEDIEGETGFAPEHIHKKVARSIEWNKKMDGQQAWRDYLHERKLR